MKTLFASILVLLGAIGAAFSQTETAPKEVPVFRILGLGVRGEGLFYRLGEKDVPVIVSEDLRSPFYQRPKSGVVELFRFEKQADGTNLRKPVVRVALSEDMKFPLVVVSGAPTGVQAQIYDDGLQSFPGGTYRVFNRLDYEVTLLAGGETTVVPRQSDRVVVGRPAGEGRTIFFQLFQVGGRDRKLLFSNNWAFSDRIRTLVVVGRPLPPSETPVVRRIAEPLDALNNPRPAEVADPAKT